VASLPDFVGSGHGAPQRVLVYDLGGGTFDVSVVEIGGEINEVRASCGNNHLGGDDFDLLLAEHIVGEVRERYGRDLGDDPRARARLLDAAEKAKIDLSTHPYARVTEEALAPGLHLDLEIARTTFEELIQRDLDGTLAEVDRALAEARLRPEQIDRVVLVGGSTRIPKVLEMLENRFECPVEHAVDPALGVALGAALQGAILGGQVFDQILIDVAAHSLGVRTLGRGSLLSEGEHFSAVIHRNTQIPATRSEVYYTIIDNQEQVLVEVYQGESIRCSENTFIGRFPFDLQPMPIGSPVVVEFSYDLDGIIRVVVSQKGTERRKEVTLSTRPTAPDAAAAPAGPRPVDNYILRKARALAASLPAGDLQERLQTAAASYESELGGDEGTPELERAENELLELLEAVEEAPLSSGA
jgi:molecular chaperone DnaK